MAQFTDISGNTKELHDLSDGRIVLYFYPKDDTPGCTTEAKEFSNLLDEFHKRGVQVFGVSKDDAQSHKAFAEKCGLTVPLLTADIPTLERFGVWVEKDLYGKKVMGIERATFLLDKEGSIVKEWRKVNPNGHARAVLEHIRQQQ